MSLNSAINLRKTFDEFNVVKNKSRKNRLTEVILGIIDSKSVQFHEIASKINRPASTASINRNIEDFFQKVDLHYLEVFAWLIQFIPHEKVVLSIDRTEWDYGKTQVNILSVIAHIGKMGVPLHFEMLDNNSGNSNWEDRINLFSDIVKNLGRQRIKYVVMDREFIGHKWLRWLKSSKIDFCVRVPKHHKILSPEGDYFSAEEVLKLGNKKVHLLPNHVVDTVSLNVSISYDDDGELLYLVGTIAPNQLKKAYAKRWSIEVFFQALKGRGFNMEKSCIRTLDRYKKLFALVSMSYTICWSMGIYLSKKNPVRVKNHGYPQFSVFRRGLNKVRDMIKSADFVELGNMIDHFRMNYLKIIG